MSHTPAYSRDQDSVPLLKGDTRSSVDLEAHSPPPAYPPHIEHVPAEEQEGISSVTYTFVPRWPMVEERQTALGVIGKTKRGTIAIAQRGFPALMAYPTDRLDLYAPARLQTSHNHEDQWVLIMDQAWPEIESKKPTVLKIQVRETSDETVARKAHQKERVTRILLSVGAACAALIFIIGMAVH